MSDILINENSQDTIIPNDKILKTDICTLNAIKRYKLKNSDKIKEYHKTYNKKLKDAKIADNPNLKLNKKELIEKISILEEKIKKFELKLNINNL